MKQVLIKQGQAVLEEVPAPEVEPGTVLVRVSHSCISAGTEMSGVKSSGEPLWKKALRKPEKIAEVAQMVMTQGVARTRSAIEGKFNVGGATGYSAAGTVIAVGEGIQQIDQLNGLISATTSEQSAASGEITQQLLAMQSIAENTASNVDLLTQSSQRLPPLAMRLEALGQTFHR